MMKLFGCILSDNEDPGMLKMPGKWVISWECFRHHMELVGERLHILQRSGLEEQVRKPSGPHIMLSSGSDTRHTSSGVNVCPKLVQYSLATFPSLPFAVEILILLLLHISKYILYRVLYWSLVT